MNRLPDHGHHLLLTVTVTVGNVNRLMFRDRSAGGNTTQKESTPGSMQHQCDRHALNMEAFRLPRLLRQPHSPDKETAMENLARYIIRASFSQERMQYLDQERKVVHTSKSESTQEPDEPYFIVHAKQISSQPSQKIVMLK